MAQTDKNHLSFYKLIIIIKMMILVSPLANSSVLQESYSVIKSGGVKVGFAIQRYEFDNKKKQWISTSYTRTNPLAGNITESTVAIADEKLQPLSYQYNGVIGKTAKSIRASFSNNQMQATVIENNQKQDNITKPLPKGAFLSTFLIYMLLKGKKGLQPGVKYSYNAIAEEKADIYPGSVYVKEIVDHKGMSLFRVLTEFNKTKFISLATAKGEAVITKSPVQGITIEMVSSPAIATKGFQLNTKALRLLFGNIPRGQENSVFKNMKKNMGKGGVLPGKGITVKGSKKGP